MDGYGGEGSRQDMRPPLPGQQPQGHQLVSVVVLFSQKRSLRVICVPIGSGCLCGCLYMWLQIMIEALFILRRTFLE